jgi:D-alanyl-D-alanine carboxypeptidase
MTAPQTGSEAGGLGTGYGLGLRLVPGGSGTLVGHTGTMPGFQASLFVDRSRRAGAVVLANATTGLRTDAVAPELLDVLEACEPTPGDLWEPATSVPAEALDVVGVWHWGNTPRVVRWDGSVLHMSDAETGERPEVFALVAGEWRGVAGYHDGERLQVVRRADGSVDHLVCSTFVLTREPYGPVSEPG